MRWSIYLAAILALAFAWIPSTRAGIYNPRETEHLYPLPATFKQFQLTLSDLRGLVVAGSTNPWIQGYQQRFEELRAAESAGNLSLGDRIELGACYLRMPTPNKEGANKPPAIVPENAIRVLEPALAAEPHNFMVLANLATAHLASGSLERALNYESLALAAWPDSHPGFTADQLRWYRRAEKFFQFLLMLRARENERGPRTDEKKPDALFGAVDWSLGEDEYRAGKISPAQWAELPGDAIPIVEQLIFWLPFDNRLYWLLGELFNAKGDVRSAATILDDLVDDNKRKEQSRILRQHWRIVREAADALGEETTEKTENVAAAPVTAAPSDKAPASWLPDPRAIAVGFVAGVVVTVLAGLQLREIRRRREQRAGSPSPGAG
jgi:tetratricopeptide (TPR) repeat protein